MFERPPMPQQFQQRHALDYSLAIPDTASLCLCLSETTDNSSTQPLQQLIFDAKQLQLPVLSTEGAT